MTTDFTRYNAEQMSNKIFGKDNRFYLMGIAAIWIVLFHIYLYVNSNIGTPPWWISIFSEGYLGVEFFFFLSAYGLSASMEKNSVMTFYKNRVVRIIPVNILFLITLFATFQRECPFDRMLIQGVCQLTGLSLFKYPEFFSAGFCFDWFTPAIILTYIIFPVTYRLTCMLIEKSNLYEIALLMLLMIICYWIYTNKHLPLCLYIYRLPIIILGMVTYIHLKRNELNRLLSIYFIAVVFAFLMWGGHKMLLLSTTIPCLLVVFSQTNFILPFNKLVSFLGKYSYEIYLAHIFPVAFFIPMGLIDNVAVLTVITIVSTAVLTTLYVCVSKYIVNKIRG